MEFFFYFTDERLTMTGPTTLNRGAEGCNRLLEDGIDTCRTLRDGRVREEKQKDFSPGVECNLRRWWSAVIGVEKIDDGGGDGHEKFDGQKYDLTVCYDADDSTVRTTSEYTFSSRVVIFSSTKGWGRVWNIPWYDTCYYALIAIEREKSSPERSSSLPLEFPGLGPKNTYSHCVHHLCTTRLSCRKSGLLAFRVHRHSKVFNRRFTRTLLKSLRFPFFILLRRFFFFFFYTLSPFYYCFVLCGIFCVIISVRSINGKNPLHFTTANRVRRCRRYYYFFSFFLFFFHS